MRFTITLLRVRFAAAPLFRFFMPGLFTACMSPPQPYTPGSHSIILLPGWDGHSYRACVGSATPLHYRSAVDTPLPALPFSVYVAHLPYSPVLVLDLIAPFAISAKRAYRMPSTALPRKVGGAILDATPAGRCYRACAPACAAALLVGCLHHPTGSLRHRMVPHAATTPQVYYVLGGRYACRLPRTPTAHCRWMCGLRVRCSGCTFFLLLPVCSALPGGRLVRTMPCLLPPRTWRVRRRVVG